MKSIHFHAVGPAWDWPTQETLPLHSFADRPLDGRGNTSISLQLDGVHILSDFGAGCFAGMQRARLPLPDIVLLSHVHPDHLNVMELDTIARALADACPDGDSKRPLVASQGTWERIPKHQRRGFQHVPASAGTTVKIECKGQSFAITGFDASSHCADGLFYVVEAADRTRIGLLYDLKSWSGVDHSSLEGLAIAVIEANTVGRCSERSGHTGLLENLDMLRSLHHPPQLTLFNHFGGREDDVLYSQGSLVSLLAALAPDLPVRWAYKGQSIDLGTLPPRNPVSVLDDEGLVVGVAEKAEAHRSGNLHASVLILVRSGDDLVVMKRHAG